jgi:hypothetical protein
MPICNSCGHETVGPVRVCERCGTEFPREDAAGDGPAAEAGGDGPPSEAAPDKAPGEPPPDTGAAGPPAADGGDEPPPKTGPPDDAPGEPADGVASPPAGRRSPAVLVLLSLLAAMVVAGVGAGVYFGLVKDDGDGDGTETTVETPPSSTPATEAAGTETPGGQPDATFLVNVCGGLSGDRRCEAPGFVRSRNKKQFYIWVLVRKAPKGRKVQILLKDASTGKNLVRPTSYTTTGASKDIFTLRISGGPFRPLRAQIRVRDGTDFVRFPRPLRITLR